MYKIHSIIFYLFSLVVFLLSLPFIVFLLLLVILVDRSNPIFTQIRSGKNGKLLKLYKITTMKLNKNSNEKYVTSLGNILRISKLDELPQLINIIKGEMNLIGPRPLFLEFNRYYKKNHSIRLNLKPGITGLAQVQLNDSTNWDSKFDLDVYYVKNKSFKLDCIILYKTFKKVILSILVKSNRPIESKDYKNDFFQNYLK